MRHGTILTVAGMAELFAALWLPWPWMLLVAYPGAVTLAVGIATTARTPGLLGKRSDGTFPLWSYVLFASWHLLYRGLGRGWHNTDEPPFTEVHPGWYVGGWPQPSHWTQWPAVVDVTCELPRTGPDTNYLYVPTWDRTPPEPEALRHAAQFAAQHHRAGQPVLVHCAQGHGRSVTVLVAALVEAGMHDSWRGALAHVKSLRPRARLSSAQAEALDAWAR